MSRQPIYDGTIMGAVSLEYIISGAALECQSRNDFKGRADEYALLMWTLIYTIRTRFMKLFQEGLEGRDDSLHPSLEQESTGYQTCI